MDASWKCFRNVVKSRWSALARAIWLSRERLKLKCQSHKQELLEQQALVRELRSEHQQQRLADLAVIDELRDRIRQLQHDNSVLQELGPRLPDDPPSGDHGYGPRMISLSVNIAQKVGFRATEATLQLVFQWLGVTQKVPHWTTIRLWMLRLGVAAMKAPIERADDWMWMVDHSNQIGSEKVLAVLGIRESQLPPPGTPLTHSRMRLLMIEPGISWKTADMEQAYLKLAARIGVPRAVLSDGASELSDGAQVLQLPSPQEHPPVLVRRDFKHKAANVLKSVVGSQPRYVEFLKQVGQTRSAIQQTELAHLVPPGARPKARFMNLETTLKWAATMLWLLNNPSAHSRASLSTDRLHLKLGWLCEYAPDVASWSACQRVISRGVKFIAERGAFLGVTEQFKQWVAPELTDEASREVASRLTTFLQTQEAGLREGERIPLSTEILESSFGLFKQLEGQHSKGGFTSLLAAFGAVLQPTTPESVREALLRASVKDAKAWIKIHIPQTLRAKRQCVYREYKSKCPGATKVGATP